MSTDQNHNPAIIFNKPENNSCNKNVNDSNANSNVNPKVKTIHDKDLIIISVNIRGWQSKSSSLIEIANETKADVICLQETHCHGDKAPSLQGYTCYFRNRSEKHKGGLSILVFDKIAKFVTKLESSNEPAEFFSLSFDCFDPCLVLTNFYGVIEGQYRKQDVLKIQSELFSTVESHSSSGADFILLGDFNHHLANELGLDKNENEDISAGGRNLSNWVTQNDFNLINVLDQSPTHYDCSTKSVQSNILDLAITNNMCLVKEFRVDSNKSFTPYRIKMSKGKRERFHTDHRSLMITLKPTWSKRPQTNKISGWNYAKEGGDSRYAQLTDDMAGEFTHAIESIKSIDELYDWYIQKVEKIKREAYGKTTSTIKRAEKVEDDKVWHKRLDEITKCVNSLGKTKITDKIWSLRAKTSNKFSDRQFVALKDPKTNLVTRSRAESYKVMLDYNESLLKKNQVDKDDELQESEDFKDIIIEFGMSSPEPEEDKELTFDEFTQVLVKIRLSGKSIYRDLVKAGPMFQLAFFDMMNRMYKNEEIPRVFNNTTLMKLYKKKGPRTELKSNRFIHLKNYPAKVFERLVMMKLEKRMASATPDFQIGGQKMSSTTEHLVTLMTYMRHIEQTQKAGVCQFLDIRSCFDVIELRDLLTQTATAGVVGKPLRNIAAFTDNIKINIQGDESGECRTITNSAGQGSGFAPVGTSLTMGVVIDEKVDLVSEQKGAKITKQINGINLSHLMFVDDLSKCCLDSEESREMGVAITKALKELKMDAHPDKSGLLVFGQNRDKLKREIEQNPTIVQNFTMGFKESETYLGMQFSSLGHSDSITKTLLARRIKCMTKSIDLRNKLEDIRVQSLGWLITAITVFKSVITSTLLYGCGAWVNMNKTQIELLESIQRQCLITVLGISNKCSYYSLLHVTDIMPATEVVKKTKITFLNDLLHIKGKGICVETLKADYAHNPKKGLISEVKQYCDEWKLSDVTQHYVDPKKLKRHIDSVMRSKVLAETLSSNSAPKHYMKVKESGMKEYFTMSKDRAMLGLAYEVGCLNLRAHRRAESLKKFGTVQCIIPACTGRDSLDHILNECQGYLSKPNKDNGVLSDFIDYLFRLNRERITRFGTSMVNWKS